MQDGDRVTIHLHGTRACSNLKQRSSCVDDAHVSGLDSSSLLSPSLGALAFLLLQTEPIFAFEFNSDLAVIVSENYS